MSKNTQEDQESVGKIWGKDGEALKHFVGIDAMYMSLSFLLSGRPIKMLLIANTGVSLKGRQVDHI